MEVDERPNLTNLLLQELKCIRQDMKTELRRLGERIEICLLLRNFNTFNYGGVSDNENEVDSTSEKNNFNSQSAEDEETESLHNEGMKYEVAEDCGKDFPMFSSTSTSSNKAIQENLTGRSLNCVNSNDTSNALLISQQTIACAPSVNHVAVCCTHNDDAQCKLSPLYVNSNTRHCAEVHSNKAPNSHEVAVAIPHSFSNKNKNSYYDIASSTYPIYSASSVLVPQSSIKCSQRPISRRKNSKKHQCVICKKYFASGDMKRHIRVHTGEKPFSCDICGKSFAVKANLTVHKKTHKLNQSLLQCSVCGKNFASETVLMNHMLVHSKDFDLQNNVT